MKVGPLGVTARKAARIARREGVSGVARRGARWAYTHTRASALDEPLLPGDVADSASLRLARPVTGVPRDRPLHIGWVTVPPGIGSGGHTTMFRMVQALEQAGHRCTLFLYDRFDSDLAEREQTVRTGWPHIRAAVRDARQGIDGVDAAFATSWDSAHVLAVHGTAPMHRFYFVQDYEPYFYARGSEYALAEDSYRLGLRCIALGRMVGDLLRSEIGLEPSVIEFGCDTEVYRRTNDGERAGVVWYVRTEAPRRGAWLARLGLAEFHRRHPEVPIHLYGNDDVPMPFPAVRHHRLSPAALNELYNRCVAGIAMSFTNISLVAEEMLAAGLLPVVNESAMARADLDNPHVLWASPTPSGIADALAAAVLGKDLTDRSRRAAASVRTDGWRPAQRDLVSLVEREAYADLTISPRTRSDR